MNQRVFILLIMFWFGSLALAQDQQKLAVDIKGMSCKFCVHNVEKNLLKIKGIDKVSVNLDKGVALITLKPNYKLDAEQIKSQIKKSGFTPGNVRAIDDK